MNNNTIVSKSKSSTSNTEDLAKEVQKPIMGARATDSARVLKFTKLLSGTTIISGIYMRIVLNNPPPS